MTVAKVLDATPGTEVAALAGGMADGESLMALKDLLNRLGSESVCTEEIFPDVSLCRRRFFSLLALDSKMNWYYICDKGLGCLVFIRVLNLMI